MQRFATRIQGSLAVIGDVHGQVKELSALLDKLRGLPGFEERWLVFIGDLVDRGPDPKGALDIVTDLLVEHSRTTVIAGNHELALSGALGLIPTPEYSNWAERWVSRYDAGSTFESYGAAFADLDDLGQRMPDRHKQFLAGLPWCVEHPRLLFVHAGLDPNTPFEMQLRILRQKDFSLNRPQWLCAQTLVNADPPPDCPVAVVSGHVRVPEVVFRRNRILVDTTGGVRGDLSCLLLPERRVVTSAAAEPVPAAAAADPPSRSWWKVWH